jgi:hypothetical protein
MSSLDPVAMLREIRSVNKDHIESFEMHKLLRVCAADIQSMSSKKVINWIVNHELVLMFQTIFDYDVSLLAALFDPSNDSTVISRKSLDNIVKNLSRDRKDLWDAEDDDIPIVHYEKRDVYIIAIVFDLKEEDRKDILDRGVGAIVKDGSYSYKEGLFWNFFKRWNHIPRILQVLEESFNSGLMILLWGIVDDQCYDIVSQYIWMNLDLTSLSSILLRVYNRHQLKIARIVVDLAATEYLEGTRSNKMLTCLVFCNFVGGKGEGFYSLSPEVLEIYNVQKQVGFFLLKDILSSGKNSSYPEVIIRTLNTVFARAELSERLDVIDLAFSHARYIPPEQIIDIFLFSIYRRCEPEHVKVIKELEARLGPQIVSYAPVMKWLKELKRDFVELSKTDRRDFLTFLLSYKPIDISYKYIYWLHENHHLELMLFKQPIKNFCLKDTLCFELRSRIVNSVLTKQAQIEFAPIYCSELEQMNFRSIKYLNYADFEFDTEIETRFQKVISNCLLNMKNLSELFDFGILVARHGTPSDLLAAMEYRQESFSFVCGFLSEGRRQAKFDITPDLHSLILECLAKWFMQNGQSIRKFYTGIGFSYLLRNADKQEEQIRTILNNEKAQKYLCPISKFEILLLQKQVISKKDIQMLLFEHEITALRNYLADRIMENWDLLDDEARNLFLFRYPKSIVRFGNPKDPGFVDYVLSLWRREEVLPGFQRYLSIDEMIVSRLRLTAHWFFVEDFEDEIKTAGFFALFTLCMDGLSS